LSARDEMPGVPAGAAGAAAYTVGPLQAGPPCCDPSPIIEVRELSVRYGRHGALEDVSLDLHRGCVTALIGPSGCGKTSLLSALNRITDLIPGCTVTGSIRFDGQDVRDPGLDLRHLRRRMGMVFQKPAPFPVSVRRNLTLPVIEHGVVPRARLDEHIERVLVDVGLWDEVKDRLDQPALALSGGQQQRLCIARALALDPQVLLMDEPCSALDPIAAGVVEDLIVALRGRFTIVIVTHNLAQARRLASYAALFWLRDRSGRLVEFGRCRQLFEAPVDPLTAAYVQGARG